MGDFFSILFSAEFPFLTYAFLTGIVASVSFGIIGTYVVVRRISYLAGAIAHSVLGGIGLSLYLQHKMSWYWLNPLVGAMVSAIFAALVIGLVSLYSKEREDSVIGALWATGMAMGLIFIAKTPGYNDPMSYLFGNILLISQKDFWMVIILDVIVVTLSILFFHKFMAISFDEEFARIRGISVEFYYILLLCLTALTVVLLVSIVGIVMVIALLTLPPAIAGMFSKRLWQMMLLSIAMCMFFTISGLAYSYSADLPSGPVIIIFAGGVYLLSATVHFLYNHRSHHLQSAE